MTIDDALARFVAQLRADGRSAHTIRQYRRHVRAFAAWAADVGPGCAVCAVGHQDLAAFLGANVAQLRPDGARKKATSVNALRSSIRCFFAYLHRAGYLRDDPARLVRRAAASPPPPRGLSDAERDGLLRVLAAGVGPEAQRDHALFAFMLATGVRLGSAVALDVEDLDLERGEVELRSTKGGRPARVYLGAGIREHLRAYLAGRATGPAFPGRGGERLSSRHVHRRLAQWAKAAGIRRAVSPHALRHAFAMNLLAKTADLSLVQAALCHRSIASTLVYARCDGERLRRAMG